MLYKHGLLDKLGTLRNESVITSRGIAQNPNLRLCNIESMRHNQACPAILIKDLQCNLESKHQTLRGRPLRLRVANGRYQSIIIVTHRMG